MCTLCRRNLLAGERYRRFEPVTGKAIGPVCSLCEPRALLEGWARVDTEPSREGAGGPSATVRLVA
jgi:hypothetical protein